MSFKKNFFRNIFVYGSYSFSTQLVSFLASLITSRLLLPSDFGLIGLITVFSNFIIIFSDSGISYAVIRSQYKSTYHRALNSISVIIGILLCFVFVLLVYPISYFYKDATLVLPSFVIAFLFIARSFNTIPVALLQKELKFSAAGKILLTATVASTISTIILAYAGFGYWSLIWSQYVNSIVTTIIVYRKKGSWFSFRKPVLIKSFQLTKILIGSVTGFNSVNYWARNSDNLIVGKFYGSGDLGIYSRAYLMLMMPLNIVSSLFSSVLYPSLVKHKHEGGNVENEYYFILKIISLLNILLAFVLIVFPGLFVKILWGENWMPVANLLPYFGLLVMTQTLMSTLGPLMVLEKKEKALMYAGWVSAAIMIGGIIYGATVSLTAIAAFYALVYILLVLPIYIFFMIGYKLRFTSHLLSFWLPKLFLSFLIWIGLYFSFPKIVVTGFILWILVVFWDTRKEVFNITGFILAKSTQKFSRNA
ncbi:MAG: oligosaccharide flippase family protein [Parafilimonas sp.]|nr:oligosaccharide flippase family protein [Parafilimonas sp.]